jgi:hypothetical protein
MKFTAKKHSENRHSSWTVCNKSRFELQKRLQFEPEGFKKLLLKQQKVCNCRQKAAEKQFCWQPKTA